jgi:hypothetical protein
MQGLKRKARALAAALLIVAAAAFLMPGTASAHGRGHAWGRNRVSGYAAVRYAPRYRYSYAYYRPYGYRYVSYRPYYVVRPRYRVVVDDPYCYDDDDDYYVRPVVVHRHHRPRVGVSLMFSSGPGFYYGGYGDPYCDW